MQVLKCFFILSILLVSSNLFAQTDTIKHTVEIISGVASKPYMPQYIYSNRYGIIDDQQADGLVRMNLEVPYKLGKNWHIRLSADVIGKPREGSSRLQQAYLRIDRDIFEFSAGRFESTMGSQNDDLSSGSMAISRNAMPLPMLKISVPRYTAVPFTKGYLEFKGDFSHGWFEKNRYTQSPYLHEKSLYFKAGGRIPVNAFMGLVHFAQWGGYTPGVGHWPAGLKDYYRILFAKGAGKNTANYSEQENALGNHLGIIDMGLTLKTKSFNVIAYRQMPWEDFSGTRFYRNRDGLFGLNMDFKENVLRFISSITLEYLHTTWQSGPGYSDFEPDLDNRGFPFGGRDNYYNHGIYRNGWTYEGMIIGTPLFTTRQRAEKYFGEGQYADYSIVNNRVKAIHLGVKGNVATKINFRVLATYSKNYGTYNGISAVVGDFWAPVDLPPSANNYVFYPPLRQFYGLIELNTRISSKRDIELTTSWGVDAGQMTHNTGVLVGLRWNGIVK